MCRAGAGQGRGAFRPLTRHDQRREKGRTLLGGPVAGSGVAAVARRHRPVGAQLSMTGTLMCGWARSGSDGQRADRDPEDGAPTLTALHVGARLGYGPIPADATVLLDCEVGLWIAAGRGCHDANAPFMPRCPGSLNTPRD